MKIPNWLFSFGFGCGMNAYGEYENTAGEGGDGYPLSKSIELKGLELLLLLVKDENT